MSWKNNLRPASFRGVPFFIDTSQYTGGRRVQLHEFPDREKPFPEDLGKVGETYRIEGHILGDDYFETKKSLREACNKPGPGELIHPYYGTLQVQAGPLSIEEDTQEGRIAKITFLFYEAGDDSFPRSIDDKEALVEAASDDALEATKGAFDENFSIAGQAGFVVNAAREKIEEAADAFEAATEGIATEADKIAELAFSIRNLKAEANDLLQSPANLSQRLLDSLNLLEEAVGVPENSFRAYSTLFTFGAGDAPVTGTTPSRLQQKNNQDVFNNFIRQAALTNATTAAIQVEYESVQAAEEVRAELIENFNSQIETTPSDDVFNTIKDLVARLVDVLPNADGDLPSLQTIELKNTGVSLLLAYDLFENPDAEQDIINRNSVRHPGFIEGGSILEVLNVDSST